MVLLGAVLCEAIYARKRKEERKRSSPAEAERKVTEAQVPVDALAALKRLAAGAKITEFAEEIEHGHTFYEGSWKARSGAKMDVLVTKTGALVEIEKQVGARQVPAAVRRAALKAAGRGAELAFEKKTMVLYEVKFQKGNSRHELLVTPDGRHVEHEIEKVKQDEDDDEGEISSDEVSKDIKVTILKHAAGGEIEEIECEDECGKFIFEVGVSIGGKEVELKVNAKGKLVSKEIEDDDDEDDDDEDDDDEDDDDEDDDDEDDDDEDDDDEDDE
ncbi:MAG: hypothetical protein GTO14_07765 [Anaerolineales bacterium]|nr:hypothetical protein [Anaerolineales bacterium]